METVLRLAASEVGDGTFLLALATALANPDRLLTVWVGSSLGMIGPNAVMSLLGGTVSMLVAEYEIWIRLVGVLYLAHTGIESVRDARRVGTAEEAEAIDARVLFIARSIFMKEITDASAYRTLATAVEEPALTVFLSGLVAFPAVMAVAVFAGSAAKIVVAKQDSKKAIAAIIFALGFYAVAEWMNEALGVSSAAAVLLVAPAAAAIYMLCSSLEVDRAKQI